jgi:hypothetical protein
MASHQDSDHLRKDSPERRAEFLKMLQIRGEVMEELGKNRMAQDRPIRKWSHNGVTVQEQEAESTGVLRISIGGGPDTPVLGDYCTFRGDQSKCIALLEKVLVAMKAV